MSNPATPTLVKITITDQLSSKMLDVLELTIEEAQGIIDRSSLKWCLANIGKDSPVTFDCFYKVIVSYKLENIID